MTGSDAPPIDASIPSSSRSSLKRSGLKSMLKAELMKLCEDKGLAHNNKATKDTLISLLLEGQGQPGTGDAPVNGPQTKEQQAIKLGFNSVGQMDTVIGVIRRLLTHCELDQLNWVAGMGCVHNSKVESAMPQGYYCDVTPGKDLSVPLVLTGV
jgi:hypothetical protein